MSDNEENKTEKDYLELGEVFKETIKNKDKEIEELKDKYLECFKLVMMSYYVVRMGDSFLSDSLRENPSLSFLVFNLEFMRAEISGFINKLNEKEDEE